MPLDLNVIPESSRSKEAMAIHKELYMRTMDTWRVHNPTDKDFVVYNDRMISNEKWVVPNQNKDIGKGKGNQDVPAFVMRRYLNKMGIELLNDKIKKDWDERKQQFRLEERGKFEETLALKTNDPKLWDEITPLLVVKMVQRYGGDDIFEEEPIQEQRDSTLSEGEQALARLGLEKKEFEDLEDSKNELMDQIS